MTGKTHPQAQFLTEKLQQAIPHARDVGMELLATAARSATLILPYRPEFLGDPQRGLIHTGVIVSLIDGAAGFAVLVALQQRVTIATLDLRVDYLRPAVSGKALTAEAECYRVTRHIAFVRASAWQDSADEPVASCQATFMLQSRAMWKTPA